MKALQAIAVILAVLIIGKFGWNYLLWGRFTGRPTTADFEAIARQGQPIAQAISDYQSDHGLLPEKWSDFVPAYLPQIPKGWGWDGTCLTHLSGAPHTVVGYWFSEGDQARWHLRGDYGHGQQISVPGPVVKKSSVSGDSLFATRLAEYEKRIAQHPHECSYYQDKIVFAALAGSNDLAVAECQRTTNLFPNWWFPQMSLAELNAGDSASEEQFKSWVQAHPDFFNYWYLARFYRDKRDTNSAFAALEKASDSFFVSQADQVVEWKRQLQLSIAGKPSKPIVEIPENAYMIAEGFALDAAGFCCKNQKYELALRIIRHCEPIEGSWEGAWGIENLAFQAQAELGLGKFDLAVAHAQRVAQENQGQLSLNTDELLQAAKAHNTNFLFKTDEEDEWSLFREPQP